ncbi:MAG: hypothetical protein FWG50_00175 [Kiritimatiellaeota bacterium]|nr:hypothetical protein [Kiritimatiellota bacterium]
MLRFVEFEPEFVMYLGKQGANAHYACTLLSGSLISLSMLLCFRSYSLRRRWFVKGLFFVLMPLLSVIPRTILFVRKEGEIPVDIIGLSALYCLICGLLPFLLLWGLTAKLFGIFSHRGAEIVGAVREPPSAQGTENCTDIERSDT